MSCHLIVGPMFSGKSTQLVTKLTTYADIGLSCLYLNSSLDQRETESQDTNVTTHSSQFKGLSSKIIGQKVSLLSSVNIEKYDVVGIDEAQFFSDLDQIVRNWVNIKRKIVIVACLDGDFQMKRFGQVLDLIPISDSIVKLNAYCMKCLQRQEHRQAFFTAKVSSSTNKQIEIGGKDKYMAVCRKCYFE